MKKLALASLFAVLAGVTLRCERDDDSKIENTRKMFEDRIWISHLPQDDRDVVHIFGLAHSGEGVYAQVSKHMQHQEMLGWHFDESDYLVVFPQTSDQAHFTVKAWECNEPPWELCAELSDDVFGGKTKFYSNWDMEIDSHGGAKSFKWQGFELFGGLSR